MVSQTISLACCAQMGKMFLMIKLQLMLVLKTFTNRYLEGLFFFIYYIKHVDFRVQIRILIFVAVLFASQALDSHSKALQINHGNGFEYFTYIKSFRFKIVLKTTKQNIFDIGVLYVVMLKAYLLSIYHVLLILKVFCQAT